MKKLTIEITLSEASCIQANLSDRANKCDNKYWRLIDKRDVSKMTPFEIERLDKEAKRALEASTRLSALARKFGDLAEKERLLDIAEKTLQS
jgi:hypothetical protein